MPASQRACSGSGLTFDMVETSIFLGREVTSVRRRSSLHRWLAALCLLLLGGTLLPGVVVAADGRLLAAACVLEPQVPADVRDHEEAAQALPDAAGKPDEASTGHQPGVLPDVPRPLVIAAGWAPASAPPGHPPVRHRLTGFSPTGPPTA